MAKTPYFGKKNTNHYTVAFYNLENLFDTKDDPNILDEDFLPDSEKGWTKKRYQKKINHLGTTISNIGFSKSRKAPTLVGVAEVENKKVLKDLIETKHLKNKGYGIILKLQTPRALPLWWIAKKGTEIIPEISCG